MQRTLSYCYALAKQSLGYDHLPRFLTHLVTFTCNARCIMCDSWQKTSENDLSLSDIEKIYKQLPMMDVVRLSGGEPFVRTDFADIAELVRRHLKPSMLHITTNGFLTDRIVTFCEQRNKKLPLFLLVSVDGYGDKHNDVRGHHKAWHYIEKTLEALAARRQELNLTLAINQTVVDKEGCDHFKQLTEWAKPYNIPVKMVMAYDASATYSLEKQTAVAGTQIGKFTTFGEFSNNDLEELLTACAQPNPNEDLFTKIAKHYYLQGIRNRLLNDKMDPNPKCVALNQHLRLMPNGDVPTCQFNSIAAGNLKSQPFSDFWSSQKKNKQRNWVKKCPGCWAECEVLPSACYTGAILPFAVKHGWQHLNNNLKLLFKPAKAALPNQAANNEAPSNSVFFRK